MDLVGVMVPRSVFNAVVHLIDLSLSCSCLFIDIGDN